MFFPSRLRAGMVVLVLLTSPLFVFHPIAFSGYTLSQNPHTVDSTRKYVDDQVPFLDTAATAAQDEPWLFLLRHRLSRGQLPLVNLQNGLGAPFLESLQPGVFYILNPLLVLIPGPSTRLLDWFSLLHVMILVTGLFLWLRLYVRREVALCVALLLGFSGATYHHLNMVHYRGFVWLPLMLQGGVRLGRGERSAGAFATLAVATLGSATAGNLQDFVMSALTFTVLCSGDILLSPSPRKWTRLAGVLSLFGVGALMASPAFLPYLMSVRDGNLASVGTVARCLAFVPSVSFTTWLLPAANGRLWDQMLIESFLSFDQQLDVPTLVTFCVIAGLGVFLLHRRDVPGPRRGMMVLLAIFLLVWAAKLLQLRVFDLCASLPLVQGIRFSKYVLHLSVVFALLAALSLESVVSLPTGPRRKVVWFAALVTLMLAGALLAAHRWGTSWHALEASNTRQGLRLVWGASLALVLVAAVVLHQRRRTAWGLLVVAILLQAVLCRPNGYFAFPLHAPRTPPSLAQSSDAQGLRLMTSALVNSNLLWDYEEVGVFDPILNRALAEVLTRHFPVFNPGFHLQVSETLLVLSPTQAEVLRFLGVEGLEFAAFLPPEPWPVENGLYRVPRPLPRAFFLSRTATAEAEARCAANDIPGAVSLIQRDLEGRERPSVTVETNGLRLRAGGAEDHPVLIINQAYNTAWNLDGVQGQKFCGTFPSWHVQASDARIWNVRYWPRGLTFALLLAAAACVTFIGTAWRLGRTRPASPAQ